MRRISEISVDDACRLRALLFDLDDTLLDGSRLSEAAYSALFRAKESGLALVAVTGRPSGWAEVVARQWPIDGAVAENGAFSCGVLDGRLVVFETSDGDAGTRRGRLAEIVEKIRAAFPSLRASDDAHARRTDFTFDIGEHERVAPQTIDEVCALSRTLGARTVVSSVHLHVTLEGADKASAVVRFLSRRFGWDPTEALATAAFIGDSDNDEACFDAFRTTIAVANFRGRPTLAPRYMTEAPRGSGFAEAAAVLVERRNRAWTAPAGAYRESAKAMIRESEMESTDLLAAAAHLYPNYRQPPLVLVRGKGTEVWDQSGKRYLDLAAGIAVTSLGHAHPGLVRALSEQAGRLIHVSNYFFNEPNLRLAERLTRLTRMDRAFFCNSGTEAVEAALKLSRRYFFAKGEERRLRVIAFEQSFHGRTLGALAATGQQAYREGFGPLPGVTHVPYGDTAAVRGAMGDDVAAILVEPVQGEGGVVPAPKGFLASLRGIADEAGALLVADEVQTGVGRTGKFLAFEHAGVEADVVVLAKGLGGGVPIGAMLCKARLSDALPPGSHGSTFGGNALASAAALAVLGALESERLVDGAADKGAHLERLLASIAARHDRHVEGSRGLGLLRALVLREQVDVRALVGTLRDEGVLVTVAGTRALRVSPPLTVSLVELDEGAAVIDRVLGAL